MPLVHRNIDDKTLNTMQKGINSFKSAERLRERLSKGIIYVLTLGRGLKNNELNNKESTDITDNKN